MNEKARRSDNLRRGLRALVEPLARMWRWRPVKRWNRCDIQKGVERLLPEKSDPTSLILAYRQAVS